MYKRSYDGEAVQSFRRGEYTIPANYRGNAFTADEPPLSDEKLTECRDNGGGAVMETVNEALLETAASVSAAEDCKAKQTVLREVPKNGILPHFDRGLEFDDLLLIGLVFLILQGADDAKKRDEMILLLAFLFLCGF